MPNSDISNMTSYIKQLRELIQSRKKIIYTVFINVFMKFLGIEKNQREKSSSIILKITFFHSHLRLFTINLEAVGEEPEKSLK